LIYVAVAIQKEKRAGGPDCFFFFGITKTTKISAKRFNIQYLIFIH
jgi:hypothetical protein